MVTIGKIISTGVGAARNTEAGLRKLFLDTKDSFTTILAGEIKKFFSHIDIQEELARALTRIQLEISATIRVVPQEGGAGGKKHSIHTVSYFTKDFPKAKRGK